MQHPEMGKLAWIHIKYGSSILLNSVYSIVYYCLLFSCHQLGQTTWLNTQLVATSVALNSISGLLCRSTTCGAMWLEGMEGPQLAQQRYTKYHHLFSNITSSDRLSDMDGRSCQKLSMGSAYQSEYRWILVIGHTTRNSTGHVSVSPARGSSANKVQHSACGESPPCGGHVPTPSYRPVVSALDSLDVSNVLSLLSLLSVLSSRPPGRAPTCGPWRFCVAPFPLSGDAAKILAVLLEIKQMAT